MERVGRLRDDRYVGPALAMPVSQALRREQFLSTTSGRIGTEAATEMCVHLRAELEAERQQHQKAVAERDTELQEKQRELERQRQEQLAFAGEIQTLRAMHKEVEERQLRTADHLQNEYLNRLQGDTATHEVWGASVCVWGGGGGGLAGCSVSVCQQYLI